MPPSFDSSTCAGRVANHFAKREPRDVRQFLDRVREEDADALFLESKNEGLILVRFHDGSVLEFPTESNGGWRVLTAQ
jgi:hypothetical protein